MASDPPLAQSLRRLPLESASLRLLPLLLRGECFGLPSCRFTGSPAWNSLLEDNDRRESA